MTLLFVDGFDTYGNTNNASVTADVLGSKYVEFISTGFKVQAGRTGSGHSLEITSSSSWLLKPDLDTTNATLYAGFGMYVDSIASVFQPFWMRTDDIWGVNIQLETTGQLSVRRKTTTLGTTTNAVISANTWAYIELKVVCANSGSYELWVDGVSELTGSGDTQEHVSKSYHNAFFIRRGFGVNPNTRFDDLYILDAAGSTNNSNLGIMEVTTIYPDGDDTTQWTANGGGTHYTEVDEEVFDTTSYIESNTSAQQDIFSYGGLASNGTVQAVQVTTECKETDADSYELKILSKNTTPTTETAATQFVGTTDFVAKRAIFDTDPDGSAWAQSTVNSNKFGVEVT